LLTDVGGAADVDAPLAIDRLPLLEGARETVARGIFSSLQPQNVRLRRAIRELATVAKHPLYPMLFDPQTSGGLLAAVPLAEAELCVAALRAAGYAAAPSIGVVAGRSDRLGPGTVGPSGGPGAQALAGLRTARPRAPFLQTVADAERSAL